MKFIKKKINIVIIVLLLIAAYTIFMGVTSKKEEDSEEVKKIEQVETILLNDIVESGDEIEVVGNVVPESKVDVVALSQGTIKSLPFDVGDDINLNQVMAYLDSSLVQTSHMNSQINYTNMINNLESIKRTTSETIRQAELGVKNAEQSVNSAQIVLDSSKDSLENTIILQDKTYDDTIEQAIISFGAFLNSIETTLSQVNYIIHAEEGPQLAGISNTLSVQDSQKLQNAKSSYTIAKSSLNILKEVDLSIYNIEGEFSNLNKALSEVKETVDYTIDALNNTVSSGSFSEASLNTQRTTFATVRSSLVTSQTNARTTMDGLGSLEISNDSNIESLESAIKSAENGVNLAQVGYDNALVALEGAKQSQTQQILAAQASVDNSLGQLNLSSNQIADLIIRAPIRGRITKKTVNTGAEVGVGQKIAEISQVDKLKIEINLPSEDIYKVSEGQKVVINDNLEGEISSIDPSADQVTKKVKVEIMFDNKNNDLIPGTFVNVKINILKGSAEAVSNEIIIIPLKALNITQTERYVFVAYCSSEACLAKKKVVTTGETKGRMIEIISGLEKTDELLVDGSKRVKDGEKIIIKE